MIIQRGRSSFRFKELVRDSVGDDALSTRLGARLEEGTAGEGRSVGRQTRAEVAASAPLLEYLGEAIVCRCEK